jgi:DNA helicase II / ATP-dependent DNA helicase PcrA
LDNAIRMAVEAAARLVLSEYRKTHPEWTGNATPIDDLAAWLHLDIATFDTQSYAPGTFGFMDSDDEENLIWICRDLTATLRRFTLAHEIGHALLHCQGGDRLRRFTSYYSTSDSANYPYAGIPEPSSLSPCQENDIHEDIANLLEQDHLQETLGSTHHYNPRSERELVANVFAAELLIPGERLTALYLHELIPAHTLATSFNVSQTALLTRLISVLNLSEQTAPSTKDKPTPTNPTKQSSTLPIKKHYDIYQQAAIEAPTPALIVAGPGSGKTSTLIGRAEYLINELAIPPQNILALTFSRKATREMEERLQQLIGSTSGMPEVSTFHAFCANLLRQHGSLVGLRSDFTLVDDAEGFSILRQQANAMSLRHYRLLQSPTHYFPDMLKAIARAKDELILPEHYATFAQQMQDQATDDDDGLIQAEKAREIAQVYALYQQELQRRGDIDFGGLLVLTIQVLNEHPEVLQEIQQKFKHILVDEFQDVNRASGVLLRVLAGDARRVWVVGDANQAIYGFRGASPANIKQFEQDFPGACILPLSQNYRSQPDLVELAEAFRCRHLEEDQSAGKNQPARPRQEESYVTIASAPNESSEIAGIIKDIQRRYQQGYTYKDMLILCRTRKQANKITRALAKAQLPVIEQGSMLEQEYMKDVLAILLFICNASGMGLMRTVNQTEHPFSQHDIEELLLAARQPETNARMLLMHGDAPLNMSIEGRHSLLRLSHILQTLMRTANIWSLLAQYLFIETSLMRDLLIQPDNHKQNRVRINDYKQILGFASHYDQQMARQQQLEQQEASSHSPEAQTIPLEPVSIEQQARGFLEYLSLLVLLRQDTSGQQENDEQELVNADTISVMTVHASKGLEYPVVYLPGLMQRRFPAQPRPGGIATPAIMLSSPQNSHESQEACLFYVGVTRARDQLILSYSDRYGKQSYKRSLYLDTLETGIPTERITRWHWPDQQTDQEESSEDEIEAAPVGLQPGQDFIDAMRSPTLSIGAIEDYLYCPRRYAYSSIYHFEDEPDGYRLFRRATQHTVNVLHKQLDGPKDLTQIPTTQEIQDVYTQQWQRLGGQHQPFAPMYEEHGHEIVEAIRQRLQTQEEMRWKLKSDYHVEVAGTNVHVPVDRVESAYDLPEQPVHFVRTSYGRQKEKFDPKPRELLYMLAYKQNYPDQKVELHNHNMSTGEQIPIKITPRKEQNLYQKVEQAIHGLEQNHYPARPDDPQRCPGCPFFFICPA